jgi:(p)ppGpp synthase/HD superfamily hydrolase
VPNQQDSCTTEEWPLPFEEEMRLAEPQWSNRQLNKAGEDLVNWMPLDGDEAFSVAYDKVYELRLAHAYPLRAVTTILRKQVLAVDPDATVYSRAKRVSSIANKLRRIRTMQLTTMQDLGGCRAVVSDINAVTVAQRQFKELRLDKPEVYDYIKEPQA